MDLQADSATEPSGDTGELPEGEALLAATGIRNILEKAPKRITMADKASAEMMGREIRRAVKRFLDDDSGPQKLGPMAPFDYDWALQHVTAALEPHHLQEVAAQFKPDDGALAADYLVVAQRVVSYLQSILPVRTVETMATSTNIDPSDTEIARFRRAFDVANDPMIVLRDMERGTLVSDQIKHLTACYPQTYAQMKMRMATGMADAMARGGVRKPWKLSYRRDRLVQVLYGTSTFTPALAADLQKSFAQTDKPKPGPAPAKSQSKAASNAQTKTAAIADGPA